MNSNDNLTNRETLEGLDAIEALQAVAELVDLSADKNASDLSEKALRWADELEARTLSDDQLVDLDYYRANAWNVRYAQRLRNRSQAWDWELPEVRQEIFLLRRARHRSAFSGLAPFRRCEILTNLASGLDHVGRFIEARQTYSQALQIEPEFWMARGNRGAALLAYARSLFDRGHKQVFALRAHQDLVAALDSIKRNPNWGNAPAFRQYLEGNVATIEAHFDIEAIANSYDPLPYSLGRSRIEQSYRRWCLHHQLFLNPLNDVEEEPIAARDQLGLPSFTTGLNESPVVVGFFNQMKQEYASARWLYFDGIQPKGVHFSDRGVTLMNTLDYPAYGLSIEQVKIAFRMAYSLFDKIAFFLNRYFALGIPERQVSFRSIWRPKPDKPIREAFAGLENWPLRGLYWLSKDLFEGELREVTEPEARELKTIRDHLEHKYLKVHEMGPYPDFAAMDPFHDDLAYSINRSRFEDSTLKLLKLTRAALIYLALGMHREERRREGMPGDQTIAMPMPLDIIPDNWKR